MFPYNLIASSLTLFLIVPLLTIVELVPTLIVALLLSELVISPPDLFVIVEVELALDAKIADFVVAVIIPELVIVKPVVLLLPVLLILIVFVFEEIFPPELFTIVASVVPFTSIAVIPVALIVPEFVTVKSEVLSANTLTVFAVSYTHLTLPTKA